MKCPKWLLEAMEKGEGVWCDVWNDAPNKVSQDLVRGYMVGATWSFMGEKGSYKNAEPHKESMCEFKPFDKVLVREHDCDTWCPTFFSCYGDDYCPFVAVDGSSWRQCVPYEGNEHLCGTIKNPK